MLFMRFLSYYTDESGVLAPGGQEFGTGRLSFTHEETVYDRII